MTIALYAGSFDPVTLGHVDIIERASQIFEKLYVAVSINTSKQAMFTPDKRADFLRGSLPKMENVSVLTSEELTVNLAEKLSASVLVRGVRGSADLDTEMSIAGLNGQLNSTIQTVFLPTANQYRDLSSSMIKEIARFQGDIKKFVPPVVAEALQSKFQ